jgi:hypothetical protein
MRFDLLPADAADAESYLKVWLNLLLPEETKIINRCTCDGGTGMNIDQWLLKEESSPEFPTILPG